jgi:hypothetical protein
MPATKPETLPPIDVGAWTRVGAVIQGSTDPKKLNDWHMGDAYAELHAGGKIHKNVGVTVNVNANMLNFGGKPPVADPATMTPNSAADQIGSVVAIEDAILQLDIDDGFHVWGGHLLVPVDRANSCGPFFMIPWNYPGFFAAGLPSGPAAPHEGPYGRNNGAVVWGDIAGGKFTYLAGAFDNADVTTSPLYSGRLRLALMDPEPGFWGNCSYFGEHDVFSIAGGAQFQSHGSASAAGDKAYAEVNADVLFEKKLGGGSFVTFEGSYYHFNVADGAVSDSLYVLGAFATSTMGLGNLQPMARFQWEKIKSGTGTNPYNIDVGVAYLIKGPAMRLIGTYGYTKLGSDASANAIQLSAQAIFF